MISFTIYNIRGQILRTGNAPEDMLEYQVSEGEFLTIGTYDDSTHYVDTSGMHTVLPMPLKPDEHHEFDYSSCCWFDPRSLNKLKDTKWEDIKLKRDESEFDLFEYNGMIFDGDVNAQRRLNGYISVSKSAILAGQEFSANFILADNSVVLLTAQDFVGIELAKITAVASVFDKATLLRKQIYEAATKEDVEKIQW